ncbi:MAG: hypothetical protein WA211_19370 [Candidatus Acidiferrales bacterium]
MSILVGIANGHKFKITDNSRITAALTTTAIALAPTIWFAIDPSAPIAPLIAPSRAAAGLASAAPRTTIKTPRQMYFAVMLFSLSALRAPLMPDNEAFARILRKSSAYVK